MPSCCQPSEIDMLIFLFFEYHIRHAFPRLSTPPYFSLTYAGYTKYTRKFYGTLLDQFSQLDQLTLRSGTVVQSRVYLHEVESDAVE